MPGAVQKFTPAQKAGSPARDHFPFSMAALALYCARTRKQDLQKQTNYAINVRKYNSTPAINASTIRNLVSSLSWLSGEVK